MLKITAREAGKVRILELKGQIKIGEEMVQLKNAVDRMIHEGQFRVVLNMKDVEWIDSSGLGELIACHTRARRASGDIKLCCLHKRVLDIIIVVGLHKYFEIYDDCMMAVGSF